MSSSDSAPLRERVNAVLFTVLMITSMFAGTVALSGTAAAGNTNPDPTSTPGTLEVSLTDDNGNVNATFRVNRTTDTVNVSYADGKQDVNVSIGDDKTSSSEAIQLAIDNATSQNDTIIVGPGGYNGSIDPANGVKKLTIKSASSTTPTLKVDGGRLLESGLPGLDIQGFQISLTNSAEIFLKSDNFSLTGNTIDVSGSSNYGLRIGDASGATIKNNTWNIGAASTNVQGVLLSSNTDANVSGNTFTGDTTGKELIIPIQLANNDGNSANISITGNEISGADFGVLLDESSSQIKDVTIRNNDIGADVGVGIAADDFTGDESTDGFSINGETDPNKIRQSLLNNNPGSTVELGSVPSDISESTDNADDADARVNVSISDPRGVDESSINVTVTNDNTSESTVLIDNGTRVNGSLTDASTFANGQDDAQESVNITLPLQEGNYTIEASADDTTGNQIADKTFDDAFTVDMEGVALRAIADDDNPLANTEAEANVAVFAVDKNENALVFNETDTNVNASDLSFTDSGPGSLSPPSDAAQTQGPFGLPANSNLSLVDPDADTLSDAAVKINTTADTDGVYSIEIGDTAPPFLSSTTADQRFTPPVANIAISINDSSNELPADGVTERQVTVQLLDDNGDPISRSGEAIDIFPNNNASESGISFSATRVTTNESGAATVTVTATNADVEVPVQANGPNSTTDTLTILTITGAIDGDQSQFKFDGSSDPSDQKTPVNNTNTATIELEDAGGNSLSGVEATFSSNNSNVEFENGSNTGAGSITVTTNSSGVASVNVTAPETVGTFTVNASARSGGATLAEQLGAGGVQVNVTAVPGAADELVVLNGSSVSLATDEGATVTVQVQDEFGNPVSGPNTPVDVNLSSPDASVVDIDADGQASAEETVRTGSNATFDIDADTAQSTITLSANASGLTNDTLVVNTELGNISAADSSVTLEGSSSDQTVTVGTTQNVSVQLSDSEGTPLPNVSVTLAGTDNANNLVIDQTIQTNASGFANTTVEIPTDKSDITLNVSANAVEASTEFNASTQPDKAQVNLTAEADDAFALQFADDDRAVAAGGTEDVTIQIADQFGNINESASANVTLSSSDTGVVEFAGPDNTTTTIAPGSFTNGVSTTSVTTSNSGGEVTLTAANASLQNATLNLTASTPDAIDVSVVDADTIANSENPATTNSTVVEVQLLNNEGNPIGVDSETVTLFTDTGISLNKTNVVTGEAGAAFVQVNATGAGDNLAINAGAENFSASGSASVTVTGPAESIRVTTNESTVNSDDDVNVTVEFVDSADRVVPRDDTARLFVENGTFLNGGSTVTVDTGSDFEATTVLTANVSSDTDVTVQAQSPGGTVKGSSTITFEAVPVVLSNPATDVNGDGQLEDVNGDGEINILDVQALFVNQDRSVVQNNVEEFDFNGDGEVNILDVQALFVNLDELKSNSDTQTQNLAEDQLEVR